LGFGLRGDLGTQCSITSVVYTTMRWSGLSQGGGTRFFPKITCTVIFYSTLTLCITSIVCYSIVNEV
jgi:hypothetical protein